MNHDAMIEEYLAGPGLLRAVVAGMTSDQLLARPIPGKWSAPEVVCHLADYEPIYADRMKRVIIVVLLGVLFPISDKRIVGFVLCENRVTPN